MNTRSSLLLISLLSYCCMTGNTQSHYPGQHAGKFAVQDQLKPAVFSFDLQDVRLLDSRFKQNMEREEAWILSIDVNSLLHSFRTNAGVFSGLEGGYDSKKNWQDGSRLIVNCEGTPPVIFYRDSPCCMHLRGLKNTRRKGIVLL